MPPLKSDAGEAYVLVFWKGRKDAASLDLYKHGKSVKHCETSK